MLRAGGQAGLLRQRCARALADQLRLHGLTGAAIAVMRELGEDPVGRPLEEVRATRDDIAQRVDLLIAKLDAVEATEEMTPTAAEGDQASQAASSSSAAGMT
jgi:hypothetical protein